MSVGSWLVLGGTLEGGGIAGVVYAARRMFPVWRERPQPALEARMPSAIQSHPAASGVPRALPTAPPTALPVLEGEIIEFWPEDKVVERGRIER